MKRFCALLFVAALFSFVFAMSSMAAAAPNVVKHTAVYLGVENYGTVNKWDADKNVVLDKFEHKFFILDDDSGIVLLKIAGAGEGKEERYVIQNTLMEGYAYEITVSGSELVTEATLLDKGFNSDSGNVIMGAVDAVSDKSITIGGKELAFGDDAKFFEITTQVGGATIAKFANLEGISAGDTAKAITRDGKAAYVLKAFVAKEYVAPVKGTPGVKTLKNFLATALEPVGTTLYIYGGTWDWQDDNSSNQSMTIGLPQSWIDFFQSHGKDYNYDNEADPAHSYNMSDYGGWNQYYYAGVDCSGYVGWIIYNTMHTESDTVANNLGYVGSARKMARRFAEQYKWGTFDEGDPKLDADGKQEVDSAERPYRIYAGHEFKVGDVFSMNGHVWISFGTCSDGSIVFSHSTPNTTKGAGAQISAVGPDKNCEAYKLASEYMNKYYPDWAERYGDQVLCLTFDAYTTVSRVEAGKFTWTLDGTGVLTDPDGYASKTPAEILADLFGEAGK